jgi:hypothetical protein
MKDEWFPIDSAPKDGTEIQLLIRHEWYEIAFDKAQWQQEVKARWIEHNGGGWTWDGMLGQPIQWRRCANGSGE